MAKLSNWRVIPALLWFVLVTTAWFVVRFDSDLHPCKTTVTDKGATTSVATEEGPRGNVKGTTRSEGSATTDTSTACEPLGAIELAVLLIPSLLLIAPALKGINIAGLFGFDFRELQEKVMTQAQEQVIRVILEQEIGTRAQRALSEVDKGDVVDL